jgi:hypothetical protein
LAVAIVAMLVAALSATFGGPSGVVIPSGGVDNSGHQAHWHLCRLPAGGAIASAGSSWLGRVEGCEMPGIDGAVTARSLRLHLPPGRYLLNMGMPTFWIRTQVRVTAHRFVTPKRWEAMSCSIQ